MLIFVKWIGKYKLNVVILRNLTKLSNYDILFLENKQMEKLKELYIQLNKKTTTLTENENQRLDKIIQICYDNNK